MPQATAGQAAVPGQPNTGEQRHQGQTSLFRRITYCILGYLALQFVLGQIVGKKQHTTTIVRDADGREVHVAANLGSIPPYQLRPKTGRPDRAARSAVPQNLAPIWPMDSLVDVVVAISPSRRPTPFADLPADRIVLREKGFRLGNYSDARVVQLTIPLPREVQNNGTLWGHFYVGLPGAQLDPTRSDFDPGTAYHFHYALTQYIPKKKEKKTRNLLAGAKKDTDDAAAARETLPHSEDEADGGHDDDAIMALGPTIANYYHPNTTLSFIPDTGIIHLPTAHPATRQFLLPEGTGARDATGLNSWYYPILFVNGFWQLKSHMTLLNDTVTTLPLRLELNNLADWKFRLMATMETNSRQAARDAAFGQSLSHVGDGSEIEMVKEVLLDTNPILLAVTFTVSIAHMVLEMLAFGSDIAHYRKKKDNVGISLRSILANVFMQAIILLYLVDQSQNTSYVILGSQALGILIELWKVTTIVNVRVRPARGLVPYRIHFEDKGQLSDTEAKTKEYDAIAFIHMYRAGVPLLLAYAAYSLVYEEHQSWYSYVVATLVGSVYAYGFLMMLPSLYINYRLQSVAHMPAKAMLYKFLNTVIDDLFAFTIKMPWLHRLATFRDDVVFLIYLYQRWVYRVDYSRVNEFGQGGDEDKGAARRQKTLEGKGEEEDEKKPEESRVAMGTGAESVAERVERRPRQRMQKQL